MIHPRRRKGLKRVLLITGLFSLVAVITAFFVQKNAEKKIAQCSYLDPIIIDLLAFAAAIFLICEGFYQLVEYPSLTVRDRFLIAIRVAFGFAILTLHTMQFFYK